MNQRPFLVFALAFTALCFLPSRAAAQRLEDSTKPIAGMRKNPPRLYALRHARIVQGKNRVIERGDIIIRNGTIEAVGQNLEIPADARVIDLDGLYVWPGFIELQSQLGIAETKKGQKTVRRGASHWNPMVVTQWQAAEQYLPTRKELEALRKNGFTTALVSGREGIFKGQSALVLLGDDAIQRSILDTGVAQHISMRPGRDRKQYPNSLMGVIALIRQTMLDATWYANGGASVEQNVSLAALAPLFAQAPPAMTRAQGLFFEVGNELNIPRALKIANEFGLDTWLFGSGQEYRQIARLAKARTKLILPLNFPKAPEVEGLLEADNVSLLTLQNWELAATNPVRLFRAGIPFALSSAGLKGPDAFMKAMRKIIAAGLPEEEALAALTLAPARMLGRYDSKMSGALGSIDAKKIANLIVTTGPIFDKDSEILETWVSGRRYEIKKRPAFDPTGLWALDCKLDDKAAPVTFTLELSGKADKLSGKLNDLPSGKSSTGENSIKLRKAQLENNRLVLSFKGEKLGFPGVVRMSGAISKKAIKGSGLLPDGTSFDWSGTWSKASAKKKKEEKKEAGTAAADQPLLYPPGAYGRAKAPIQEAAILLTNATIWTSGPMGKLVGADIYMKNGVIAAIGPNLTVSSDNVLRINAKGKHVTPGLIDAHSHSAISGGVNEGTQSCTAEVRIQDVINPHSINLYRELAGGLTVINLLHGSANPIGGQMAVIKLRWGSQAEEMLFAEAAPGIKFALGENVKQSNWGDDFKTRYPQTRMGVETYIRDRFQAALDYRKQDGRNQGGNGTGAKRRDLELDCLLEIIDKKRMVHCHSYRQDEILMLMRVAESYGFRICTFQHVLEGYKVAEHLARHGAMASTFSDWWAYKFEVIDAIPFNGSLMRENGVIVSFNSDSSELARRMNLEAAKAVKYGGTSEEEALKFVTLNPAKQLRIEQYVGSLEVGKHADFVIWSGHPLSTFTRCEQTWIEGRKYFDLEEDKRMRAAAAKERRRLIQKVLAADPEQEDKKGKKKEAGQ